MSQEIEGTELLNSLYEEERQIEELLGALSKEKQREYAREVAEKLPEGTTLFEWKGYNSLDEDIGGTASTHCKYCGGLKEFKDGEDAYGDNTDQYVKCTLCGWHGHRTIKYKSDSYRKAYFGASTVIDFDKSDLNSNATLLYGYIDEEDSQNKEDKGLKIYKDEDVLKARLSYIDNEYIVRSFRECYIDWESSTVYIVLPCDNKDGNSMAEYLLYGTNTIGSPLFALQVDFEEFQKCLQAVGVECEIYDFSKYM